MLKFKKINNFTNVSTKVKYNVKIKMFTGVKVHIIRLNAFTRIKVVFTDNDYVDMF